MSTATRRRVLLDAVMGAGALGLSSLACAAPGARPGAAGPAGPPAPAAPVRPAGAGLPTGGPNDFDFLVGTWEGANRRLKRRWVGSTDWDEFTGHLRCESRLGGIVNIDEVDFPERGFSGMTVRTYDVAQRRWFLYWINSRTGALFPPVAGGFTGARGDFYGDDTDDGRPVKVHFQWTVVSRDLVRWQQAFSLDGARWETNWTVEHRRV